MASEIIVMLVAAISAASGWFSVILVACGLLTFVTGCVAISMAVRHLLFPIIGAPSAGAGSDSVKRLKGKKGK